ncbi:MAG: SRPBCC family protein [Plectolyngbya sp. WJT66-NPBG17]|jgi:uncharacterized membrane protein|nr:SRPBCC family protein [Plectolyngbya sp. WJT66-NPBG17]
MAEWLENTAQVEVETPIDQVWQFWADLEQLPNWMNWITSVKLLEGQPELSRWTLSTTGFQFSWKSRITKQIPNQIIQWESIDGLPNRGAIRFYDRAESTIVKMTISYAVPEILARVINAPFVGRFVESTIQADLDRFRDYALANRDRAPKESSSN